MAAISFDAYFARIGFNGRATATLDTLRELQRLHTTAIAFENLDPLMGQPVSLDLTALHDKLVSRRRGGYCYEQNSFVERAARQRHHQLSGVGHPIAVGEGYAERYGDGRDCPSLWRPFQTHIPDYVPRRDF